MEIEIIKTENPDVVIERKTVDIEINLQTLRDRKEAIELFVAEKVKHLNLLNSQLETLSDEIKSIVFEKINDLELSIDSDNNEILKLNSFLNGSNL